MFWKVAAATAFVAVLFATVTEALRFNAAPPDAVEIVVKAAAEIDMLSVETLLLTTLIAVELKSVVELLRNRDLASIESMPFNKLRISALMVFF